MGDQQDKSQANYPIPRTFYFLLEPQQLALAALTDPGELSAVEALTNGSMFTSINTEVTNFPDLFPFSRSCFLLAPSIPSLSC